MVARCHLARATSRKIYIFRLSFEATHMTQLVMHVADLVKGNFPSSRSNFRVQTENSSFEGETSHMTVN